VREKEVDNNEELDEGTESMRDDFVDIIFIFITFSV
jgi:hypothetical protein